MKQKARFTYKNYKGEVSLRNVRIKSIHYGSNQYHKEQQWLIIGYDFDKEAERTFALKDITEWFGKIIGIEDAKGITTSRFSCKDKNESMPPRTESNDKTDCIHYKHNCSAITCLGCTRYIKKNFIGVDFDDNGNQVETRIVTADYGAIEKRIAELEASKPKPKCHKWVNKNCQYSPTCDGCIVYEVSDDEYDVTSCRNKYGYVINEACIGFFDECKSTDQTDKCEGCDKFNVEPSTIEPPVGQEGKKEIEKWCGTCRYEDDCEGIECDDKNSGWKQKEVLKVTVNTMDGNKLNFNFDKKFLSIIEVMKKEMNCSNVNCEECPFEDNDSTEDLDCDSKGFVFGVVTSLEFKLIQ